MLLNDLKEYNTLVSSHFQIFICDLVGLEFGKAVYSVLKNVPKSHKYDSSQCTRIKTQAQPDTLADKLQKMLILSDCRQPPYMKYEIVSELQHKTGKR